MSAKERIWLAVCLFLFVLHLQDTAILETDFRTFYESAEAWRDGRPIYDTSFRLNLNPPTLAVVLTPLTYCRCGRRTGSGRSAARSRSWRHFA